MDRPHTMPPIDFLALCGQTMMHELGKAALSAQHAYWTKERFLVFAGQAYDDTEANTAAWREALSKPGADEEVKAP